MNDCLKRPVMECTRSTLGSVPSRCGGCVFQMKLKQTLIFLVMFASLAAVVVPQFSNATVQTPEDALKDDLRYLRTQIAFFKAQHRDLSPGYPGGDAVAAPDAALFVRQMTACSDDRCNTSLTPSAVFKLGPYLREIPANPLTGQCGLLIFTGATTPSADESQPYGWLYNPATLQIMPNLQGSDAAGMPYADY